jgi:hypothetical protein
LGEIRAEEKRKEVITSSVLWTTNLVEAMQATAVARNARTSEEITQAIAAARSAGISAEIMLRTVGVKAAAIGQESMRAIAAARSVVTSVDS